MKDIESEVQRLHVPEIVDYLRTAELNSRMSNVWAQLACVCTLAVGFLLSPYRADESIPAWMTYSAVLLALMAVIGLSSGVVPRAVTRVAFVLTVGDALRFLSAGSSNHLLWQVACFSALLIASAPLHKEMVSYGLTCAGLLAMLVLPNRDEFRTHVESGWMASMMATAMVFGFVINVICFVDKVRIHKIQCRLIELAFQDALTRINNRRAFWGELERAVRSGASAPFFFLLVDVDDFKEVNDQHGHDVGDATLQMIANRLQAVVGPAHCGRLGGEEFGALVFGDRSEAESRARTLSASIASSAVAGANVTISIGMARYRPNVTVSRLAKAADQALYQAKSQGKNRFVVQDEEALSR